MAMSILQEYSFVIAHFLDLFRRSAFFQTLMNSIIQ